MLFTVCLKTRQVRGACNLDDGYTSHPLVNEVLHADRTHAHMHVARTPVCRCKSIRVNALQAEDERALQHEVGHDCRDLARRHGSSSGLSTAATMTAMQEHAQTT
jgi:hypothetical protein